MNRTADEGPHDDFRILTCLRRRIELLFVATLPRCETFGFLEFKVSLCFLSTDSYACFPLPSSGSCGRPLREPCSSPTFLGNMGL
jgi:hypothetical protein